MRVLNRSSLHTQAAQGVSGPQVIPPQSAAQTGGDDFNSMLEAILAPNGSNQVSEEALFAALTVERVKSLKGQEAASRYQELLSSTETSMRVGDYVPYEDSARIALRDFRNGGELTKAEADKIHSEAFGAAQLDDNLSALYDDIGGNGSDPTFAALDLSEAITLAKGTIEKYDSGELTATSRALDAGFSADGSAIVNPFDDGGSGVAGANSPVDGSSEDNATTDSGQAASQSAKLAPGELLSSFVLGGQSGPTATNILLRSSMGKIVEEGYGTSLHAERPDTSRRSLQKI